MKSKTSFLFLLWSLAAAIGSAQHTPTPREAPAGAFEGQPYARHRGSGDAEGGGDDPAGENPHEVACDDQGKVAYITNYGTGRGGYNTLTVADLVAQKPLPTIDLGALHGPHGIWFAGGKVYFTAEVNKVIGRYDPAAQKVDWVMGTGQNITHMIKVTPDGTRIFTSNILSGSVSLMENFTQEGMKATRFSPGANDWRVTSLVVGEPTEEYEGFDVSPDWKELWTASPRGNVAVEDTASKKLSRCWTRK